MREQVYDILDCGPNHRFYADGKLVHNCSGGDKLNLQNLPSRGGKNTIRRAIMAPEGHSLVVCDSSQIEARIVAWLAGQDDLVQAFANKEDVYKRMASKIYDIPVEEVDHDTRFIAKTVVLGCGYGMSANKFRDYIGLQGVKLDEEEAQRIIKTYRKTNDQIAKLWYDVNRKLTKMIDGTKVEVGTMKLVGDRQGFHLPNGMTIRYPGLRYSSNDDSYYYDSRYGPKKIYGAAAVENCIAGGTKVLTPRGWIPIEFVQDTDLVHDGVQWVRHDGLVSKGEQEVMLVDGIWMTPDHKVLTDDGWKTASQNPQPYRPDIRHVEGTIASPQHWSKKVLELRMSVRNKMCKRGRKVTQSWAPSSLRVPNQDQYVESAIQARHVKAPCVCGMEKHDRSVPSAFTSGMDELRRAWHNGVSEVAGFVRELLGGHGTFVPARLGLGPDRQRRGLLSRELQVDRPSNQLHEQAQHRTAGGRTRAIQSNRNIEVDSVLQTTARPVFDIVNAGPRHRFVVLGDSGPMVVHNCVQALARIVVFDQMMKMNLEIANMNRPGRLFRTVLSVHDETVLVVPDDSAEWALGRIIEIMSQPPKWASDLPVACEGSIAKRYGDTKG